MVKTDSRTMPSDTVCNVSADEVSERIKRAALKRFVDVGYGSSTVDQIAASAEVGVASLYRRWSDKATLANELTSDYLAMLEQLLASIQGATGKERFLALWHRLWDQAELDPELLLFVEAQVHAGFMTDEVAARKEAAGEQWMNVMVDLDMGADPATATAMLVGTLTSVWQQGLDVDRDDLGARLWAALAAA